MEEQSYIVEMRKALSEIDVTFQKTVTLYKGQAHIQELLNEYSPIRELVDPTEIDTYPAVLTPGSSTKLARPCWYLPGMGYIGVDFSELQRGMPFVLHPKKS